MKSFNICCAVLSLGIMDSNVSGQLKPSSESVFTLTQKAVDWQMATFDEHHKYRGIPAKWIDREKAYQPYNDLVWHMGALYAGMIEWYKLSGDRDIKDFLLKIGFQNPH